MHHDAIAVLSVSKLNMVLHWYKCYDHLEFPQVCYTLTLIQLKLDFTPRWNFLWPKFHLNFLFIGIQFYPLSNWWNKPFLEHQFPWMVLHHQWVNKPVLSTFADRDLGHQWPVVIDTEPDPDLKIGYSRTSGLYGQQISQFWAVGSVTKALFSLCWYHLSVIPRSIASMGPLGTVSSWDIFLYRPIWGFGRLALGFFSGLL